MHSRSIKLPVTLPRTEHVPHNTTTRRKRHSFQVSIRSDQVKHTQTALNQRRYDAIAYVSVGANLLLTPVYYVW